VLEWIYDVIIHYWSTWILEIEVRWGSFGCDTHVTQKLGRMRPVIWKSRPLSGRLDVNGRRLIGANSDITIGRVDDRSLIVSMPIDSQILLAPIT
jgi:hypothetical protein